MKKPTLPLVILTALLLSCYAKQQTVKNATSQDSCTLNATAM